LKRPGSGAEARAAGQQVLVAALMASLPRVLKAALVALVLVAVLLRMVLGVLEVVLLLTTSSKVVGLRGAAMAGRWAFHEISLFLSHGPAPFRGALYDIACLLYLLAVLPRLLHVHSDS
jgi:hypothetical protein